MSVLLSIAYFPPVEYFARIAGCSAVFIDPSERYEKQSWRNRCRILTSNGPMDLRFPIVHGEDKSIKHVRVDYSTPWVRQTEYAIETAYSASPYFEYYRDELFGILDSCPETLWELDMRILEFFCRKIGLKMPSEGTEGDMDLRGAIHPKHKSSYEPVPYWQVFGNKFGFVGNLSVMDLLFNEGPESICRL